MLGNTPIASHSEDMLALGLFLSCYILLPLLQARYIYLWCNVTGSLNTPTLFNNL